MNKYLLSFGLASIGLLPVMADWNESKWKDLNLTPEQKNQVMAIKEKHKEAMNRDIEAVLKPEQKAKFQQIKAEQKAKWEDKKQDMKNDK